jgi:hypothetical protein
MTSQIQCSPSEAVRLFVAELVAEPVQKVSSQNREEADVLVRHWPEYVIEAACLGFFMLSACSFKVLLQHPASPMRRLLPDAGLRRFSKPLTPSIFRRSTRAITTTPSERK